MSSAEFTRGVNLEIKFSAFYSGEWQIVFEGDRVAASRQREFDGPKEHNPDDPYDHDPPTFQSSLIPFQLGLSARRGRQPANLWTPESGHHFSFPLR